MGSSLPIFGLSLSNYRVVDSGIPEIDNDFSEIDGIKFFSNRQSCIDDYNANYYTYIALNFFQSIWELVSAAFYYIGLYFRNCQEQIDYLIHPQDSNFNKDKLVVALHGLNCTPKLFEKTLIELKCHNLESIDLFVPEVLMRGNVALDDAVAPILKEIKRWAANGYNKELVLVGISNGGRIAKAIDCELGRLSVCKNIKKIHVISIAGSCNGSVLADLAHKLGLDFLMSDPISNEMPTNSTRSKILHESWKKSLKDSSFIDRKYTFIASAHDWIVPNFDSTLLEVEEAKTKYAIVKGHGHISIVNRVAKVVSQFIMES
jgi:hypothetical protein